MLKLSRCGIVWMAGFFTFCVSPGCIVADGSLPRLVSRGALKQAELEILWQTKLPMKTGESLQQLSVFGTRIYALSSRNYLVGINKEKGNVIFSTSITGADFPVVGLGAYKDTVYSIAGNKLVEIHSDSGEQRSAKRLMFGVTCPAARNKPFFYVAGTDRRMHALRSDDKVQVFEVASDTGSKITSVAADDDSVVFATVAGELMCIAPEASRRLWQFKAKTDGAIAHPVARDADSVFAASRDSYVYRLDAKTGALIWKYQTGAMLAKGPHVTDRIVYQYARDEGLSAIDKQTGKLLWKLPDALDLLAEAGDKSYVITGDEKLVVMDNTKAKMLVSVDLPGVSRYAVNTADSKIYVADEKGRIACLSPIKY